MPNYIVVCCYQCKLFQGQQENKQKKFKCKVCGEKQSVRHVFARSDYPKDIRGIVQELNQKRVEMLDKEQSANPQFSESTLNEEEEYIQPRNDERKPEQGKSIWAAFVDEPVQENDVQQEDHQFVTDISFLFPSSSQPKKRRGSRSDRKDTNKSKDRKQEEVVDRFDITEEAEFILPHPTSASYPSFFNEYPRKNEFSPKRSSAIEQESEHASWSNKRQCVTTTTDNSEESSHKTPKLSHTSFNEVRGLQPIQQNNKEITPSKEEEPIFVTDLEYDLQEYQTQSSFQEKSTSQEPQLQPKKNSLWNSFL